MILACIDTFTRPANSPEQRGDIVVIALADHPWGVEDLGVLQVTQLDDPMLEAELLMMRDSGDPHPTIAYPYAVYEDTLG